MSEPTHSPAELGWSRFCLKDAVAWADSRERWGRACRIAFDLIHGGRPRAALVSTWIAVQRN